MRKQILLFSLIFLMSCGSQIATKRNQMWSNHFSSDEQKEMLYQQAVKQFNKGKRELSITHLKKAQEAFRFLAIEFVYDKADKKVKEVDKFIDRHVEYYRDLFNQAKKKNLMFTAAGYAKQILRLKPNDITSTEYLTTNKEEIDKRLDRNLSAGYTYMKQKKLNSAKRCFNRILVYDPDHQQSIAALSDIRRQKRQIRIAASKKAKPKKQPTKSTKPTKAVEPDKVAELSASEKEKMYILGIKAYEQKDYIKAFNFFENLVETTYKDSILYYKRAEDKINVLGLSEDD